MKTRNFKYISVLVLIGIMITSCTKDLAELNKNPNAYDTANPLFLFTKSQLSVMSLNPNGNRFNLMQQLQQEATYSEVTAPGDKYFAEGYVRGNWAAYNGPVNQIDLVIQNTKDDESVNKLAAARIWRVYIYHQLTDLYGDIPYFEASKGQNGSFTPKYDLQADIYKDLFKELEEAAASFNAAKPIYGASDLLFDGNVVKWKKFAYSMMLRLGMRLTKVDAALAKTWVEKAIVGGPILDDADIAKIPYADGGLASNRNPFSDQMRVLDYVDGQNPLNVQGSKLSKTFIDHLKGNSTTTKDPRLNAISVLWYRTTTTVPYVPDTTTARQKGMKNAEFKAYPADYETYSEPNPNTVMRYDAPVVVMSSAEGHFLLAEAAIRGWYSGNASTSYENGVRAAMRQWSLYGAGGAISSEKINYYLVNNPFKAAGSFEQKLEQISTQKWVLFYLDQIENFANWRRTGYPALVPTNYPGNITGGKIPRRYIVPESEEQLNTVNFNAAKTRQSGANTLLSRVWWDKE